MPVARLVRTEMFAVGFRNPWRFSIDAPTGRIFCGDVGGDALEEVSVITKGGNYGWAVKEQVGKMVMMLLNLKEPLPVDAADAAAVAIGHLLATRRT